MKKWLFVFIIIILAAVGAILVMRRSETTVYDQPPAASNKQASSSPMQIQSPAFGPNQSIPKKYTCDGQDVNPPLEFSGVPAEAKSLALIVDDPDAPNGDWVHWLVWNISPSTTTIAEKSVPAEATEGATSFGKPGYGGPCPPAGSVHRYRFKLYALEEKLSLPTRSTKQDLEAAMNGSIIAQAELVGVYNRQ